jgi:glutaredoxin
MNVKILILVLVGSVLLGGVGVAELYKWVDDKGAVHFSDRPPEGAESVGEVTTIATPKFRHPCSNPSGSDIGEQSARREPAVQEADEQALYQTPEVELFTTSWCGYCGKARDYFRSRGISFTEYDIERDRNAAQRKRNLDPRGGVPFAVVNGQPIHGYAPSAYARALERTR